MQSDTRNFSGCGAAAQNRTANVALRTLTRLCPPGRPGAGPAGQPALGGPASAGGSGQGTCGGPFPPQPQCVGLAGAACGAGSERPAGELRSWAARSGWAPAAGAAPSPEVGGWGTGCWQAAGGGSWRGVGERAPRGLWEPLWHK